MSALAQAFLDAGSRVTGADRSLGAGDGARTPVLAALEREGVRFLDDETVDMAAHQIRLDV